jgi:outer membrane lipoprotein-sorting protein
VNILRRLPISRLLLLCALVVGLGVSATALAFALGKGPTPPPTPLSNAIHGALAAPPVEGVSASVKLTNHLLEGANLASGGGEASQLASSPLLSGASGRLWISKDGRARLELQAEKGDTQVLYDGHTLSVYDASSNTLYRFKVPAREGQSSPGSDSTAREHQRHVPSVAKIDEAISHLSEHANVSGAVPTNVAGQPAYTARISPKETGSLIGGLELSWDAVHGVPLRAAVYSSTSSAPVVELAASEVSYGPVDSSVFQFTPPSGAKIEEVAGPGAGASGSSGDSGKGGGHPTLTTRGHGVSTIAVIESKANAGGQSSSPGISEGLQKVKINGVSATELPTALGTVLGFERSGVRYMLVGAVTPGAIEAVAKGL